MSEGKKIRYKVVLALNHVNKDLYNPRSFDNVPLEMMPYLLEMLQQRIGYSGFGKVIAPDMDMDNKFYSHWRRESWNPLSREWEKKSSKEIESLSRVYEMIMSSQNLPLLFARGAGDFDFKSSERKSTKTEKANSKEKKKPRKRSKFGDEEDEDDEAYIPKGARKTGKRVWNPDTRRYDYIPPPVY